jgi:RimJ/RimL family protein N-acetyltransferase
MTRANASTRITGQHVVLVPYCRRHVDRYHGWMQDKELQTLTASEPLTVEEEYRMQQTWRDDADKCTFIVLDRHALEAHAASSRHVSVDAVGAGPAHGGAAAAPPPDVAAMVGDVNLFLGEAGPGGREADINIMVAEKRARRRGLAREAMLLMMRFGAERLGATRFVAKILDRNGASLRLFLSQPLGFRVWRKVEVFGETHLVLEGADELERIKRLAAHGAVEDGVEGFLDEAAAGPSAGAVRRPGAAASPPRALTQHEFWAEVEDVMADYEIEDVDEGVEETLLQLEERGADVRGLDTTAAGVRSFRAARGERRRA